MIRLLAIALALTVTSPAFARDANSPVSQAISSSPTDEIIDIVFDDPGLPKRVSDALETSFVTASAKNPNSTKIEASYPGFLAAVKAQIAIEISSWIPELRQRTRTFLHNTLTEKLTPTELIVVRNFFRSPTGSRFIAGAQKGAQTAVLRGVAGAVDSGDPTIKPQVVDDMQRTAVRAGTNALLPGDRPVVVAFGKTLAARKLAMLQNELPAATRTMVNAEIQRVVPVLQKRIGDFVDKYMAENRKR